MRNIECFWYITSVDNLESIFENGILCRTLIEEYGISATDISYSTVQRRRVEYHDYVPLFFADNTPMLYVVFKEQYENVCLLEINKGVMEIEGVKFSNGNVASEETVVYDSLDDITNEEWEIIYSRHPTYWDRKRIRSAEVLVPDEVSVEYITSISVDKDKEPANPYNRILSLVEEAGLDIPINMNLTLSGVCQ